MTDSIVYRALTGTSALVLVQLKRHIKRRCQGFVAHADDLATVQDHASRWRNQLARLFAIRTEVEAAVSADPALTLADYQARYSELDTAISALENATAGNYESRLSSIIAGLDEDPFY